jgi:hypothetical protein
LTFFYKVSPIFSQKTPFYVLNHHKSPRKRSISPEISENPIVHNARICHPSDFWFQIRDSRGISWGDFLHLSPPSFYTQMQGENCHFFGARYAALRPRKLVPPKRILMAFHFFFRWNLTSLLFFIECFKDND